MTHSYRSRFGAAALCLAAAFATSAARAQTASDAAAAQALFDDAKRLTAEGKDAEACPKFEESQRLAPGSGTLVNLARCYERTARFASAWSTYLRAAASAKGAGNAEREAAARELAAALSPRLSNLVVEVPPASRVEGLEVTRDGVVVGTAQLGVAIPADAGDHVIEAKAPGKKPWRTVATVQGEASTTSVSIPVLEAAPRLVESAPAPSRPATDTSGLGTQRVLALVAGGIGVVGIGVGTVFGLQAKSKHDEAAKYCRGLACTDQTGVDASSDAYAAGNVATVGIIVGAAGLAGGVVLWFTAPDSSTTRVGLGPGKLHVTGEF